MKKKKDMGREHPTARAVRILLASLLIMLGVSLAVGGICLIAVGRGIDYVADLELLESYAGSRTTRLYCHRGGFDPNMPITESEYDPVELDRICGAEDRVWLSEEALPALVRNAFVAIEDKRFYKHDGVDWMRTVRAALNSVLHFDRRFGGSTITQQLIKNVSGESEATALRKLREILRASALERSLSKGEILAYYLNIVPLANRCYGVCAAARYYFGKSVAELLPEEAAALAAITNAPARYDPVRCPEANRRRRNVILSEMAAQGYLAKEAAEAAMARETVLHLTESKEGGRICNWYTETVISDVIRDLSRKLGLSEKSAEAMVYGGGLTVRTLCDPTLQEAVDSYFDGLGDIGASGASAAFILIDPRDGALLAVRGGSGEKTGNRLLSYATDVRRPPGSALKPLSVYAPALKDRLIHYGTVFDDAPSASGWPHNTPDVYAGRMPVCEAIAESKNTVAVQLYEMLGAERIARSLEEEWGLRLLHPSAGSTLTDLAPAPLALGQLSEGVSLLELTAAYTAFASGGLRFSPRSYLSVYDRNGRCLLEAPPSVQRVLSEEDAYIMTELLAGVTDHGTASGILLKNRLATAGKTGTSGNALDRWFIGYTPYLLGGVLVCGNGKSLAGSGISQTSIWDQIMMRLHAKLSYTEDAAIAFPVPSGIVPGRFCADSGALPSDACLYDPRGDRIRTGPFTEDNMPTAPCEVHVLLGYDRLRGQYRRVEESLLPFFLRPYTAALDDTGRELPEGAEVADMMYDLSVFLGEKEKHPDGQGTERRRFRIFGH